MNISHTESENAMRTPTFADLLKVVDRHARYDFETEITGLKVVRSDYPTEFGHWLYQPSFGVVLQGEKHLMLAERPFHYQTGGSLVCVTDVPVTSQVSEASPAAPYLAIHLDIDPEVVVDLLHHRCGMRPNPDKTPIAAMHQLDPMLHDPLIRLLSLLDRPRDIPVMAPLIRREITWRLLDTEHGVHLSQLAFSTGHAARVGRATAWIRENFSEALNIPVLADLASMSVSGFHRHFKLVTSMSPLQFQKRVRLQEARRGLPGASTISAVAYDVGYESLSQFNRDYRRLFNVTPSEDTSQLRAMLGKDFVPSGHSALA
ncbi:AraC family transcriptional regulator [Agrobacterium pusense]|uniref:AraC family transcriptional regulator n=1 Tax=Agrobacterium pusense TaxID=648995 RepID=UPI00289FE828|nr:AraC family transcriptional regulator [Agrobacterium pusense]